MATATASAPEPVREDAAVGIVCGGGTIPRVVAEAVRRSGRRVVLFALRGWAEPRTLEGFPHHWVALGQVGRFLALARGEGCRDIVLIGALLRPALRDIRLDWTTLRLLPRVATLLRGGDDRLIAGVAGILEERGFHLVGAHQVAPEILVPAGALTRRTPSARDQSDIARALAVIKALSPHDVGQAAIVADGYVVAIEAAEGTDAMLARVADLRRAGRLKTPPGVGVLVKAPKHGQDHRFDLPSIGPRTIEGAAEAGLAGVAVAAGAAIMADPGRVAAVAEQRSLFLLGIAGAEA
jgi:UDP-2,3-diacylglucosamine hydrolase